jgi:hypothetical protein
MRSLILTYLCRMIFPKKLVSIAAPAVLLAGIALFFIRATHNEEDKIKEEFVLMLKNVMIRNCLPMYIGNHKRS